MEPPVRILLFGDSFVRRLRDFTFAPASSRHFPDPVSLHRGPLDNFFFADSDYSVRSFGWGGATLKPAEDRRPKSILTAVDVVARCEPSIVYLHVGSNDLCNPDIDPSKLARDIFTFAEYLVDGHAVQVVVISAILHRRTVPAAVSDYNRRVDLANRRLSRVLERSTDHTNSIILDSHTGLKDSTQDIFASDGIHLNLAGNLKLCKGVRRALIRASEPRCIYS